MHRPDPAPATREEAIELEIEAVEAELRRVGSRLQGITWNAAPARRRVAESWSEIALGLPRDTQADGDEIARRCLQGKKDALVFRLTELRQQLAGPRTRERPGRW